MNLPTLIVLLLVALALFFALRSWRRAAKRGGCGSCNGCASAGNCGNSETTYRKCPKCSSTEDRAAGRRK